MATAYLRDGARAAERPVCFAFNGGPGSASIWPQFGALGPRRVVVPDDGSTPARAYVVDDNGQRRGAQEVALRRWRRGRAG